MYTKDHAANDALLRAIRALGTARAALLDAYALSDGGVFSDENTAAEAYAIIEDVIAWAEREHAENARLLERLAWAAGETNQTPETEARGRGRGFWARLRAVFA